MAPVRPLTWIATALLALLAACGGGGGGGGGTTDLAGGGIGGTGISTGPITATGSVVAASLGGAVTASAVGTSATTVPTITVNGGLFELPGSATVTLNGTAGSAADLRLGQVVTVHFTGDPASVATAEAVTYDPALTAPVEAVDTAGGRIKILGQWVAVDTLLDADGEDGSNIGLTDLSADDLLEVSGERDADGVLHATRIERKGHADPQTTPVEVEVEGVVADLAPNHGQFTLDTSGTSVTVVVPAGLSLEGTLADGATVDVEGSLSGSTLTAKQIEVKGSPVEAQPEGNRVELDGFITATDHLAMDDEIEVNGVVVRLTDTTEIRRGESGMATRAHLQPNTEVEVEGTSDGSGAVVAERITLDG